MIHCKPGCPGGGDGEKRTAEGHLGAEKYKQNVFLHVWRALVWSAGFFGGELCIFIYIYIYCMLILAQE